MADCELLPKCLYFNDKLEKMPTASEGVKSMYCRWHYEECATDLFPPDSLWAEKILAQYYRTH
jgi:hypothetical protein